MAAIFRLIVLPMSGQSWLWLAATELEANAVDGFDDIIAIVRRQLGADVANMAVDGAIGHLDVELVGRRHDLVPAEHRAGPGQKGAQDSELDRGQAQWR